MNELPAVLDRPRFMLLSAQQSRAWSPAVRHFFTHVGIFVGVMIAFGTMPRRPSGVGWIDLLVTALVAAIGLALLLAGVVEPFIRRVRRTTVTTAALHVIGVLVTLVGGIALFALATMVPHGSWTALPVTPEPAIGLEGPDCVELSSSRILPVVVTTRSGRRLVFDANGDGWATEPPPPANALDMRRDPFCGPEHRHRVPPILGTAIARHAAIERGADCAGEHHFALERDGSIRTWSTHGCAISQMGGFLFFVIMLFVIGNFGIGSRLHGDSAPRWLPR